jgi:hypothetical protein
MEANNRLEILLQKYLNGDIDLKDQEALFEMLLDNVNTEVLLQQIEADLLLEEDMNTIIHPQIYLMKFL